MFGLAMFWMGGGLPAARRHLQFIFERGVACTEDFRL